LPLGWGLGSYPLCGRRGSFDCGLHGPERRSCHGHVAATGDRLLGWPLGCERPAWYTRERHTAGWVRTCGAWDRDSLQQPTNEAELSGRVDAFDIAMLATLQLVAINKHHDTDMLWLVETDDFGIYLCGGQVRIIFIFIWIMHTVKTWRFCTNKKKTSVHTHSTPHRPDIWVGSVVVSWWHQSHASSGWVLKTNLVSAVID
jgi:hypothetical protein